MHVSRFAASTALAASLSASAIIQADLIEVTPISVGSGLMSSYVQIDFMEGPTYVFEVFHGGGMTTGMDLLLILNAELGDQFVLDFDTFDFGNIITTLGFNDLVQSSDVEASQFWLYWVRDSADVAWEFSGAGKTGRQVSNGSWDGWVFGGGIDDAPIQIKLIPAPTSTLALAGLLIVGHRRRR